MNDDELKELIGEASDSLSEEDGKFQNEQLELLRGRADLSDDVRSKKEKELKMMMIVGFENYKNNWKRRMSKMVNSFE